MTCSREQAASCSPPGASAIPVPTVGSCLDFPQGWIGICKPKDPFSFPNLALGHDIYHSDRGQIRTQTMCRCSDLQSDFAGESTYGKDCDTNTFVGSLAPPGKRPFSFSTSLVSTHPSCALSSFSMPWQPSTMSLSLLF